MHGDVYYSNYFMVEHPFWQRLTLEQHKLLSEQCVPVQLAARAEVFAQGEEAEFLYFLVEGRVSIRYKPYDGPQITITRLHAGDVFGWSSVVGNATYTAGAVSTSPIRALRIRGSEIRSLCAKHPDVGAEILDKLAVAVAPRWKDSQEQVQRLLKTQIMSDPIRHRIA